VVSMWCRRLNERKSVRVPPRGTRRSERRCAHATSSQDATPIRTLAYRDGRNL